MGGHFIAMEESEFLAEEILAFFRFYRQKEGKVENPIPTLPYIFHLNYYFFKRAPFVAITSLYQ